jgi:ATP-binding cassette subfamily B protein
VPPSLLRGAIAVEGLTFAYGQGEPVLRDVSFSVAPGETLAILGPPGSGKSTIIQLLLRLYDYAQGSFRLDGLELRDLDPRFVRAQVGVVLQEPFLYSKTIGANVRVGRSAATHDEIVASATAASIHGTIEEFQDGYDTLVGERGVTLSGGQRQRVALARALLRDAPILVLDDALSAVDTRTETRILAALRERRGRHTTIVIAHRLSSVAHADRILVLEKGAIVQAGAHRELLEQDGPYRRLWRIQEEELDEVQA